MKKRGIELVKLRSFKQNLSGTKLSCSCTGDGCTVKVEVDVTKELPFEEALHKAVCALADNIDPYYEWVDIYGRYDEFDVMVGKVEKYMENNDWGIEVSSWSVIKKGDMFRVYCCSQHPEGLFKTLGEALRTLPCYPDQQYPRQIKWEDVYSQGVLV